MNLKEKINKKRQQIKKKIKEITFYLFSCVSIQTLHVTLFLLLYQKISL